MAPDLVPAGDDDDDSVVDAELLDGDPLAADGSETGDPDLGELLGGLDFNSLLGSAVQMQQDMLAAQAATAAQEFEGQAGGGVVRIVVTGSMEFRSVTIAPEVVDPGDVEMLQDLILAALHDATSRAVQAAADSMPTIPGMDVLAGMGGGDATGFDLASLLGTDFADDSDELEIAVDDDEPGAE